MRVFEYLEEFNEISVIVRLSLAAVLGAVIGLERSKKRQAAGMRTFALVCVGSAITVIVNLYLYEISGGVADPGRIPAGVVSGVGFLGVGTIMITHRNHVKGLTTAAGLWATAALGLMIGVGKILNALVTFVIIIFITQVMLIISRHEQDNSRMLELYLELEGGKGLTALMDYIEQNGFEIASMEKKQVKNMIHYDLSVQMELDLKKRQNHTRVKNAISKIEGIHYMEEIKV